MSSRLERIRLLLKSEDYKRFQWTVLRYSLPVLPLIFGLALSHEIGHILAGAVFGVPVRYVALDRVQVLGTAPESVLLVMRLAGGLFEAGLSFLAYFAVHKRFGWDLENSLARSYAGLIWRIVLLTLSFHGVVWGILEGFFPEAYAVIGSLTTPQAFLIGLGLLALAIYDHWPLQKEFNRAFQRFRADAFQRMQSQQTP